MAGGSHGYRAALAMRQPTPERISSSPGTAGLPPFISSSTSCPEPGRVVLIQAEEQASRQGSDGFEAVFSVRGPGQSMHGVGRLPWSYGPPDDPQRLTGTDVGVTKDGNRIFRTIEINVEDFMPERKRLRRIRITSSNPSQSCPVNEVNSWLNLTKIRSHLRNSEPVNGLRRPWSLSLPSVLF